MLINNVKIDYNEMVDFPSFIQLYPTLRCNQGCLFCFNQGISKSTPYGDMDVRYAHALGNVLVKNGVREIDILGGEPMLIPWMKGFVKEMTNSGTTVNISTNGSLPESIDHISELPTELMNLGFSLHGFPETHNALTQADNFSKAVMIIKRTIESGKDPIVKSILTRGNMDEIYDLVDYLNNLGVKRYFLIHEDIVGRQKNTPCYSFPEFREFCLKLKENFTGALNIGFVAASGFYKYGMRSQGRCDAGIEKIAIMPDGSVFPCNLFSGLKEFYLGNIFRDGIDKIWKNPLLNYFREYTSNNRCGMRDCNHYSTCTGGCPAHSFYFSGTMDAVDPRCIITKKSGKVI